MARDYYRVAGVPGYLMSVQADILHALTTVVVVPLEALKDALPTMGRLNPIIEIGEERFVMVTQAITAVSKRELGESLGKIGHDKHIEITQALDMLFSGY
jgi:toxin CcdB